MDGAGVSNPQSVITGCSTGSVPENALILRRIAVYLAVLMVAAGVVLIAGRQSPIPLLKGEALRAARMKKFVRHGQARSYRDSPNATHAPSPIIPAPEAIR
jgi:hypothetical protein